MINIKEFRLTKLNPKDELAIERGELKTSEPACCLTIVVKNVTKAKLFLQGHDTIIGGNGFIKTGKNEFTLKCYNNKQVINLMNYYRKIF